MSNHPSISLQSVCHRCITSFGCRAFCVLLILATWGRHYACNMSCVGRLSSGCSVPWYWQSLCLRREPLPIALTDQALSAAVQSAVCHSTTKARNALGYWRHSHFHTALTNRISQRGTLDLYLWTVVCTLSWVLCVAWSEWRRSKDNRGCRILLLQKTCR